MALQWNRASRQLVARFKNRYDNQQDTVVLSAMSDEPVAVSLSGSAFHLFYLNVALQHASAVEATDEEIVAVAAREPELGRLATDGLVVVKEGKTWRQAGSLADFVTRLHDDKEPYFRDLRAVPEAGADDEAEDAPDSESEPEADEVF